MRRGEREPKSPPRTEATYQHMTCTREEVDDDDQLVYVKREKARAHLGVKEVLTLASDLPDGQIGLIPVLTDPVDERANLDPGIVADCIHDRRGQRRPRDQRGRTNEASTASERGRLREEG